MMRSFSIREVILVAVVSFVVSGLGGALLNAYLNRAKLTLTVTSLGFEGGFVEVDDELIKASENDDWGVPFERFVDFRTLLAREKASSEMVLRLQAAQQHVDRWLTPITTDEAQEVLTKTEVRRSPYLGSETTVMGSSIPGQLRRRDFPDLPIALEQVREHPRLWPVEKRSRVWLIHLQTQAVSFPLHEDFSERETTQQELIAESLSRGIARNIVHIHQVFSERAAREILNLQRLRDAIRSNLAAKARIALTVSIANTGASPAILEPYLLGYARIADENLPFTLKVSGKVVADTDDRLPSPQQRQGERFLVENYLRETGTLPYIAVAPGESKEVILTYGSPIFRAVREKRCKAVHTPGKRSPTGPECALVTG